MALAFVARPVTRFEYDKQGRRTRTIFPNGDTTHSPPAVYDIRRRVITQYAMRGNPITFEYDSAGRQIKVTDALNHSTWTQYNAAGQRVAVKDALGRVTKFTYDVFGRLTETEFPPAATGQPVTTKKSEYDKRGLSIAEIDQNNKRTEFVYDRLGRLIEVHDPLNGAANAWKYEYDKSGNRTNQIDALGRETVWTYDGHGRMKTRKLPDQAEMEAMAYDAAGNLIEATKFDQRKIAYTYDDLNRQIVRNYPGSETDDQLAYDLAGQRVRTVDAYGTRDFDYDSRGRLIRVDHPTGEAISYKYDAQGNQIAVFTLDDGTTLTAQSMTYDELNRLETVTADGKTTWTYEYNEVGARKAQINPSNTRTDYFYDNLNRVTRIHTYRYTFSDPPTADLLDLNYEMDAAGNRTKITEKLDGVLVCETTYTYDDLYRLTSETRTGDALAYTRSYTYDAVGNRLMQVTVGPGEVNETRNYTYNTRDQLRFEEVVDSRIIEYHYTLNGSLSEKLDPLEGTTQYTWDSRERMIQVTKPDQTEVTFTYDTDGNRIRRDVTTGGTTTTTRFLVDVKNATGHSQVFRETDGGNDEVVRYVYGDDLLKQIRVGEGLFYHYDAIGSSRALSGSDGSSAITYDYYGFGESLADSNMVTNDYTFVGEQLDPELGMYYLRARYMDPRMGAFSSLDVVLGSPQIPLSAHKYIYSHANPTNLTDPSGQSALTEALVVLSLASVIAMTGCNSTHSLPPTVFTIEMFSGDPGLRGNTPKGTYHYEVDSKATLDRVLRDFISPRAKRSKKAEIKIFAHGSNGAFVGIRTEVRYNRDRTELGRYFVEGVVGTEMHSRFGVLGRLSDIDIKFYTCDFMSEVESDPNFLDTSLLGWYQYFNTNPIKGPDEGVNWGVVNQIPDDAIDDDNLKFNENRKWPYTYHQFIEYPGMKRVN